LQLKIKNRIFLLFLQNFYPIKNNLEFKKMTLKQTVMNYLKKEGFSPKIENKKDIMFTLDDLILWVSIEKDDELYFRLETACEWDLTGEDERDKALEVANEVNSTMKVAKLIVAENIVYSVADMFLGNTSDIDKFFMKSVAAVKFALEMFISDISGFDTTEIIDYNYEDDDEDEQSTANIFSLY
jgi:hypothetical protein